MAGPVPRKAALCTAFQRRPGTRLPSGMKRRCLIAAAVVAALGLAGAVLVLGLKWSQWRARNEWNRQAIATVAALTADTSWVASQMATLKSQPLEEDSSRSGWMSDNLILLKTGEWIVYTNACQKENWRLEDMFIGKTSNSRWCYTTFHFCRQMIALPMMMGRPTDLQSFQKEFFVREFDGALDAELKRTWPRSKGQE